MTPKEICLSQMWKDTPGEIVWLDDPLKYTYLRETPCIFPTRRFPVRRKIWGEQARIVGYELWAHLGPSIFSFRVWWLKAHDRDIHPEGIYKYSNPVEAVIPSSITTGKKSLDYITPPELLVHHFDHRAKILRGER